MAKIHQSKEEKFKESLKLRPNDNRPFIREKEDKVKDAIDYEKKYQRILEAKMEVAKITGDKLEDIHIWTNHCEDTFIGMIRDWSETE